MTTLLDPTRTRELLARDEALAELLRRTEARRAAIRTEICAATNALSDPAAFWVWLALQDPDERVPTDAHLLEHYYRAHGFEDAECQTECGSRDCEGCGERLDRWRNECDGSWQNLRLAGEVCELDSWEFYEVLPIDNATTYGEAFAEFDEVMLEREAERLAEERERALIRAASIAHYAEQDRLWTCLARALRNLAEV